jgi:type 1 glutamine amidotransferase
MRKQAVCQDIPHCCLSRLHYPISWIKAHGPGRVFYCSLGVWKPPYLAPLFPQYLLAGIQFANGDLPADTTPSEK